MAKAVRRALGLLLAWSMALAVQPVASAQTSVSAGRTLSEAERTVLSDQIKEVMVKQEFYVHTTPQEKAFLHLDKPYYTKGDTIWYRAYTLLANSMVPDTLNGTLYVDLVQQDGKVLTSSPLYLDRGMASGHIAFRDSLVPGYYMIRAYTSWMRNFSDEPLYSALVPIYGETGEDKQTRWIYSRSVKSGEGNEDTLQLHLMLTDNNFNPWSFQPFKFDFRSRFIRALQDEMTTAADGTADISVEIPRDVRRDVAALRLLVRNDEGRNEKTDFSISLIRNDSLQIQFLPEGGHLVDGVCSRLAYKALDMGGMGLKVAGSVYASDRDTALVRFESSDLGMGAFYITPQPGVSYRAEVHAVRNGATASPVFDFALPDPLPRGYVMEVSSVTRGDIQVFVKRKGIADEEMLGLAVRSGGRITAGKVLLMRQDSVMFTLPRAQFDSGVSQITLFDAAGMPCCERMLFINKYQPLRITAKFDKAEYRPREKVTLDIQVEDADGQPAEASLSVSVTDAGLVPDTSRIGATLLTHMLLTSDLRGKVERPGEYFADTTLARKKALDLLMLTQGWRRYDLARALEDRPDYPWRFEFALRIPGSSATSRRDVPWQTCASSAPPARWLRTPSRRTAGCTR
ncbi:MAG: hypothetical protein IKI72_05080 [Bacteroidales bacterium]|nr:hypothetical protein [Bacteroidales bacterium]